MNLCESITFPRFLPETCRAYGNTPLQSMIVAILFPAILTARAVNSADYQSIVMLWRWVIRVLSGRRMVGGAFFRGLRPDGLTHG